jgi:folate-dependent phosphoribosylglycinamide formyltransferase PurN
MGELTAVRGPVVLLATDGPATRAVYHALASEHTGVRVILEEPVGRTVLLRRRAARIGYRRATGQLLFLLGVVPLLRWRAAARVREIVREHGLDERPIPAAALQRVPSVNAPAAREALRLLAPAVVVVSGTRIISPETLAAVEVPFLNMHAGLTPGYRGVHGGYWALRDGAPACVGTTIHLVDPGIDTGTVVEFVRFGVTDRDSFATYPRLHTAAGLPALRRAVRSALAGTLQPLNQGPATETRLRHHPTAGEYLVGRLARGVR